MSNETAIIQKVFARVKSGGTVYHDKKVFYQSNPHIFAHEILGIDLTDYQIEIMQQFVTRRRIAVRAPHGAGKTALSACLVLWAMTCFEVEVKVITTASAWRQLIYYTWPEIRKWAKRADWSALGLTIRDGKELLAKTLVIKGAGKTPDNIALAAASDNTSSMEGAHAPIMFVVFDEAKEIPVAMWDALEGAFSMGETFALAISTPGERSGRFFDIHTRKPGLLNWWVRHISLQECVTAKRIKPDWVDECKLMWGAASAVFQNRVLGEFADSGEDSVIPLSWIEAANKRWGEMQEMPGPFGDEAWGIDPAYKGEDHTAFAHLIGNYLASIDDDAKQDLMITAGKAIAAVHFDKSIPIGIDVIGVGAGVYSRLAEQGYNAVSVNVSERTDATDHSGKQLFANLRAYVWWCIREALDPALDAQLALPPDDELTGDLTAPMWWYQSNGKIVVESKDDMRERIGRSPDKGDALCLAYYALHHQGWSFESINRIATNELNPDKLDDYTRDLLRLSGISLEQFRRMTGDS